MIPKTIHYCWISGDEFPEKIARYIASWKKILTDYNFILWNYKKISEDIPESRESLWLQQAIKTKKYAFAADFVRVFALNRYGGIYLDTDVEVFGTFDSFLGNDLFIGFDYANDLEPAVIGSIPGHPWIQKILAFYRNKSFINKDESLNTEPLPVIFDRLSKGLFNYERNGKFQKIELLGIVIFPYDYFSPKDIYFNRIRKTNNTVSIHHFDGSWVEKNLIWYLKRIVHQGIYFFGGKYFHDRIIAIFRKLIKY